MMLDMDLVRGLIIIILLISFAAMVVWLWFMADQEQLNSAARLALDESPLTDELAPETRAAADGE